MVLVDGMYRGWDRQNRIGIVGGSLIGSSSPQIQSKRVHPVTQSSRVHDTNHVHSSVRLFPATRQIKECSKCVSWLDG